MTSYYPENEIPSSFWALIRRVNQDSDLLWQELEKLEKNEVLGVFSIYREAQLELVDKLLSTNAVMDASEDVIDDLADGIVAQGKESYIQTYSLLRELPPRSEWERLPLLIHTFYSFYEVQFNEDILGEFE